MFLLTFMKFKLERKLAWMFIIPWIFTGCHSIVQGSTRHQRTWVINPNRSVFYRAGNERFVLRGFFEALCQTLSHRTTFHLSASLPHTRYLSKTALRLIGGVFHSVRNVKNVLLWNLAELLRYCVTAGIRLNNKHLYRGTFHTLSNSNSNTRTRQNLLGQI